MVDKIQNISYDLEVYNNYVDFPIATANIEDFNFEDYYIILTLELENLVLL